MKKVLVIVAHSDDEVIGCGGTLLKHRDEGDEIQIIYMTNGVDSRVNTSKKDEDNRLSSQLKVCNQLKVSAYYNFNYPDNKMDTVPLLSITQSIETVLTKFQPEIVYTHHAGDLNIDHRIVLQATLTAIRPQPNCSVKEIISFEVNSSTEWSTPSMTSEFLPNYFVDISSYIIEKRQLLEHYALEMRDYPHSRSIKAIEYKNHNRGNQVGLNSAEAFSILRKITI